MEHGAVGAFAATEVMTLHHTGEASALADADHVNHVVGFELIDAHLVAGLQIAIAGAETEFPEGDFWQKRNGKFKLTVRNSGTKAIQSFRLASEAFTIPGYVYPVPFHAASNAELRPGAEISFEREDWIFKSETIQGWIFYPASITFADNTKWEPREQGECFITFWRDKNHPPMPMKPITQYDFGEMDPD